MKFADKPLGHAAVLMASVAWLALATAERASAGNPQLPPGHELTFYFDEPEQPLTKALTAYAKITGSQLVYRAELTNGLAAKPLKGRLSRVQALNMLLADSGLVYAFADISTVTLRIPGDGRDARAQAETLPKITVRSPRRAPTRAPAPPPAPAESKVNPNSAMVSLPEYAGGQVATGGRLGMLGNRNVMDTPFSQTTYTAKTIQDQQARSIGDVLQNDPSVRVVSNAGNNFDIFHIRGFYYESSDMSMNGLYGMVPYYYTGANFIERVEVLKGPSALLNGMPPAGAIGGSINLITKQAPDYPITQLTTTYQSRSHFGTYVDVARRYGANKEFGVRFNGSYRNGRTQFDDQHDEFGNAVVNMDYRGERVRISADVGYQADSLDVPQRFLTIASTMKVVPPAPEAGSNYGMPSWSYWKPKDKFAMVQGEVDITDRITAYGAFGWHRSEIDFRYVSPTVNNTGGVGGWQAFPFRGVTNYETRVGQAGLRATVDTGPVRHNLNLNYSEVDRPNDDAFYRAGLVTSNLYNPRDLALPSFALLARTATERNFSSVGVADTMSVLDERIQVTVGARRQRVTTSTTNLFTNATVSYDQSVWSPAYAVVVKPLKNVSLFGNYIEGLQPGTVVGAGFTNVGQAFAPFRTTQKEVGIKVDFGRVMTTVAAFDITRPSIISVGVSPNASQRPDGEQRNRGIEVSTYGELAPNLRILGGVAFIDGRLTKTTNGINDGNKAQGVADINVNMGAEWDTPFVRGLTATGRIIHTTSQYINSTNTLSIPDWTRVDLGARYTFAAPWNGKPVTVRFTVENVFDKTYWNESYSADGVVTLGAPRTYLASTTFNF
jgi:iron complex outermembrane receptor protein